MMRLVLLLVVAAWPGHGFTQDAKTLTDLVDSVRNDAALRQTVRAECEARFRAER